MTDAFQPLAGKVALITGASRGIGAACARVLLAAGANVTISARDEQALSAFAGSLGAIHRPAPLADIDSGEFDHVIAASLRSTYLSMRAEIPAMLQAGGGTIVNITSTAAIKGGARHVRVRRRQSRRGRAHQDSRARLLHTAHQDQRDRPGTDPRRPHPERPAAGPGTSCGTGTDAPHGAASPAATGAPLMAGGTG
jgi:NAD(P)-dependent dehydrogenase (short-subunit alcohol dehydrogenase family)